jgi:hypothetical protein
VAICRKQRGKNKIVPAIRRIERGLPHTPREAANSHANYGVGGVIISAKECGEAEFAREAANSHAIYGVGRVNN